MRKNIITLVLIVTCSFSEVTIKEIDKMIDKIRKPREGISLEKLSLVADPFKAYTVETNTTKVEEKEKQREFSLNGIMNNKVYIDGEWYKKDDNVTDYTLRFIGKKGVVLTRERNIVKVFLNKQKNEIITIKGR